MNQKQRQRRRQREQRERQRFTQTPTPRQARRRSRREANLAYGDTMRENAGLIRASRQRERQINDWYSNFAREMGASRDAVQAAYDQSQANQLAAMQTVAGQDNARQAQLSAQDAQMSQLTGTPFNTVTPAQAAAAANQRNLYGAALAAPLGQQAASAFRYGTEMRNNVRGEGIQQKLKEGKRRMGLRQDRQALRKERGQYAAKLMNEERKGARDYRVQLAAANLENRKFGREGEENEKNREIDWFNAKTNRKNAERGGSSGGPSRSEAQGVKEDKENALQTVHQFIGLYGYPRTDASRRELEHLVSKESGISARDAAWAVNRYLNRHPRGTGNKQGGAHR